MPSFGGDGHEITREPGAGRRARRSARGVGAHGGHKGLESIRTLIVENESTNHAVDQSRGTEPPWDSSESTGFDAIDLENDVYVTHAATNSGGFEGLATTIINAEVSYQLDHRAGTVANIGEPDFATSTIAAAAHETIARGAAENGDGLDVRTVDDRMTLESGGRVVEIIDIGPTAHTEHLLVA